MAEDTTTFFDISEPILITDLCEKIGASVSDAALENEYLSGVAPLMDANKGDLSFIDNPKYVAMLATTNATACICAPKFADKLPDHVIPLISNEPYKAFAKASSYFYPAANRPLPSSGIGEISSLAFVDESAVLEDGVTVEAFAYIGAGAQIGAGSYIGSSVRIDDRVKVGRDCSICANAVLQHALVGDRVIIHPGVFIGQDGFGFAMSPAGHLKVPQVGRVILQDDVEIGAGTTVDRGANRDTVVGEGTKIDNQVQIGHNVVVGRHCVIVSQVGISGSSTLEDFVAIGGQSGVNGHVTIGMGAQIAAVSVVHGDVPAGARWGGVPARPVRDWFKEQQLLKRMVKGAKEK